MTVVHSIAEFNRGRDPERLAMKLRAMRADPFVFLRGTCHLFYARLPRDPLLRSAPPTWLCGDLHLQNMGSYKGDNRLVYYDINDFDEAQNKCPPLRSHAFGALPAFRTVGNAFLRGTGRGRIQ